MLTGHSFICIAKKQHFVSSFPHIFHILEFKSTKTKLWTFHQLTTGTKVRSLQFKEIIIINDNAFLMPVRVRWFKSIIEIEFFTEQKKKYLLSSQAFFSCFQDTEMKSILRNFLNKFNSNKLVLETILQFKHKIIFTFQFQIALVRKNVFYFSDSVTLNSYKESKSAKSILSSWRCCLIIAFNLTLLAIPMIPTILRLSKASTQCLRYQMIDQKILCMLSLTFAGNVYKSLQGNTNPSESGTPTKLFLKGNHRWDR